MNKYSLGQTLYYIATGHFRSGEVVDIHQDEFDANIFYYTLVEKDGTAGNFEESDLYDNIQEAQITFNGSEMIPPLPTLALGQEVYVVSNKNVRFWSDGASIQRGVIVSFASNGEKVQYLVKLDNPQETNVGFTSNQNLFWLLESNFGETFFISYNEALTAYQQQVSTLLKWKFIWELDIEGEITTGEILVLATTGASIDLGALSTPGAVLSFFAEATTATVEINDLAFSTESLWIDPSSLAPITIEKGNKEQIGSGALQETGGDQQTAIIQIKTQLNVLTVSFKYSKV